MRYYLRSRSAIIGFVVFALGMASLPMCGKTGKDGTVLSARNIVPEEMLGWIRQDTVETYDRESIFNYINGAGEVYRSFGFQQVTVFRFLKTEEPEIIVELFDMGSAEDAYGVFSHARESEETGIGQGYEYRGGLLSFWQAGYFVCVLATSSSASIKEVVFALGREISNRLPTRGNKPALVEFLPQKDLLAHSVRFFHLHSSLNYHYFLAENNILNLGSHTHAVLAMYAPSPICLLCVQYPTAQEALEGHAGFVGGYLPETKGHETVQIEHGKWVAVKHVRQYVVIVFDAPTEEYANELANALENRLPE